MTPSKLPVLPLPHPIVLLPASRFTLPLSREAGESILALIEQSDALPVVAAVPITNPPSPTPEDPVFSEWGTATRILRLVKPPARNPRQPYLVSLHGLTRIRLTSPITVTNGKEQPNSALGPHLVIHDIEYPPTEKTPSREAVEKFRESALRLLDRLARESIQQSRKDGYYKIASMLDDITYARAPWMADVLVGSINVEYSDKLGTRSIILSFFFFAYFLLSYSGHSRS
jgi:ATP-dependent Lon protease